MYDSATPHFQKPKNVMMTELEEDEDMLFMTPSVDNISLGGPNNNCIFTQ